MKPQKNFLRASYILSILFASLLNVELIRAWAIVKKCYTEEQLKKEGFDLEVKWMFESWTADLKSKEKEKGNTYMIKDRIRWSLFQLFIAGLQSLEVAQITSITLIDLLYFIAIYKDIFKRRTFESLGVKIKYVFQEVAILTFLTVLSIFAIFDSKEFRQTGLFKFLEVLVIIGVIVAIGAEVVAVIWGIIDAIKTFKEDLAKKKLLKKMTIVEKEARVSSEEAGLEFRRKGTVNEQIRKFATRKQGGRLNFDAVL